ncbi:aromatic motif membrane protein [Candidatus Mycoplasma pogonae]
MRFKKMFFLAPVGLPFLLISCAHVDSYSIVQTSFETAQKQIINYYQSDEQKWNIFLKSEPINNLLNTVFSDEKAKNDYIKSQMKIDTKKTLENLKTYLYYRNDVQIIAPEIQKLEWGDLYKDSIWKNWLWFLFNINKFKFMYKPQENLNKFSNSEFEKKWAENTLIIGTFWQPQDNKFIDFTDVLFFEDESETTKKIYLLHSSGFIFEFSAEKYYYEEDVTTYNNLIPYGKIFKNVLFKNIAPQDFPFQKYAQISAFLGNDLINDLEVANFEENLGGEALIYTLIDVNDKIK